jgi:carbon monoxide dehydrogenase subunit G
MDLGISMSDASHYSITGSNIGVGVTVANGTASGTASFYASSNSGQLTVNGTGGACSSSCSSNVGGFFAGQQAQQIGLSYHVSDAIKGNLEGVGAFGRGDILPPTATPTTAPPTQTTGL